MMEEFKKSIFICPTCNKNLCYNDKEYKCENGHLFDRSKYGYINLLMSNKSTSHHGDDLNMIKARTSFLNLGYYDKLRQNVCNSATKYCNDGYKVCDIGCGEGYYTIEIAKQLSSKYNNLVFSGIDISKDALKSASRSCKEIEFGVASAYKLPYETKSQNLILNMFAPYSFEEYTRIANDECYMIRVFPAEKHLYDLKKSVYEKVYENEIDTFEFDGFDLLEKSRLTYSITLKNNDEIKALFDMTPYSYKTSREDMSKLNDLDKLETIVDFYILVFKKR